MSERTATSGMRLNETKNALGPRQKLNRTTAGRFETRVSRTPAIAASAIILIVVALTGIFVLGYRSSEDRGSARPTGPAILAAGPPPLGTPTPIASPAPCGDGSTPVLGSLNRIATVTFNGVISNEAASAKNWQMQSWKVAQGASLETDPTGPSVAVDFVLDGFYSAVFESGASVSRHDASGGASLSVVMPGKPVDLTYGDAVAFDPSKGVKITNASHSIELDFKRALFTVEPAATEAPVIAGAMVQLDASGTIPAVIGTIGAEETATFQLAYLNPGPRSVCLSAGRLNDPVGALSNPTGVPGNGFILILGYHEG